MSMKIKKPTFKRPNIKKILKGIGKFILNTFTVVTIIGGGILAFASYINPTPYIAEYFPNLQYGIYNLETLYVDVQWWQSLQYYNYGISSGLIVVGLLIHIRSIGKLIRAIKSSPKAIYNAPIKTYKKLRLWRDWLFEKIEFLNSESKKWRTAFNIAKSPYSLLRALGFSPQMALGLLTVSSTVGSGVVINETILAERNFTNGDAGIYAAPNNIPSETLESAMMFRKDNKKDNTLRIVLATTPVSEIGIYNVTIGTAYTSSTLPSGKTEAVLVEGTDVSGGVATRLEIGELTIEKSRCKSMDFSDINAHTINIFYNASDGQSISQTAGTARMRAIGGGHHQANSLSTNGGTYDRIWIDAPNSGVNGKIDKLILSNLWTKGGSCTFRQMDIGTLNIKLNEVGQGNGFDSKEFTVATTVTAQVWNVTGNVEVTIAEPTTQ
tara:strand:- start:3160 stop:4473 length:1314 start_codon:yes stop_codon:yes gene_type:complete